MTEQPGKTGNRLRGGSAVELSTESVQMAKGKESTSLQQMSFTDQLPDFLRDSGGGDRGRENVGVDDIVIPRLELVQDLSPARKRNDPAYIEGAQEGMLYNNITRALYGTEVMAVPVAFRKEWLLWKPRKEGGGFGGAYNSEQEAERARVRMDEGDSYEVVDTHQMFCLIVTEDGSTEEVVVSMAKSKAKVARKWNSLIRIANGDSFSRVYKVSAVPDQNNKGQGYFNLDVKPAGYPSEALYRKAEAMYEAFKQGTIRADRTQEDIDRGGDTEY